jgi:hypothetical protein
MLYLYFMPQRILRMLFLTVLAGILSWSLHAQSLSFPDPESDSLRSYIQSKYGLDQELFNGFQYYKRFIKYKGDPFFPGDSFYEGSVFIGGVDYNQLRLRYNCYSQFLVLEYTDYQGRYNQLRLNTDHIDSFQLENEYYQKLSLFSEEALFYQVLSSGPVTCYIHWKKMINATNDDMQYSHEYSKALRTYYINFRGEIQAFNNRKSFLSIFPESMAVEIRKYIRNQRFSFKEAGPDDIRNLMNFINQQEETLSKH